MPHFLTRLSRAGNVHLTEASVSMFVDSLLSTLEPLVDDSEVSKLTPAYFLIVQRTKSLGELQLAQTIEKSTSPESAAVCRHLHPDQKRALALADKQDDW